MASLNDPKAKFTRTKSSRSSSRSHPTRSGSAEPSPSIPLCATGYVPSHQATDNLAMMRSISGLIIVDPCDALDREQAVPQIAAHNGLVRMARCASLMARAHSTSTEHRMHTNQLKETLGVRSPGAIRWTVQF